MLFNMFNNSFLSTTYLLCFSDEFIRLQKEEVIKYQMFNSNEHTNVIQIKIIF